MDESGNVYRQWTQRDNYGSVEVLRLRDGQVDASPVAGTETNYNRAGLLSFSSPSLRGSDVYRCRPEQGFGFCRHPAAPLGEPLGGYPSIASPILLKDQAVFGGLDGSDARRAVVGGEAWAFRTPFGKAISAPVAVCDGRIYFGGEDGYFYVLGPGGNAKLPDRDLRLNEIRGVPNAVYGRDQSRLGLRPDPVGTESQPTTTPGAAADDWFTSFGNWANTNTTRQAIRPPLKLRWIRRYEGTVKHFSVCGGGRMYTHTAEGQVFAVEQETGRLLWRRYFPGVHVSYTSPLYYQGRLLVPQAGIDSCRLRCLDAATGNAALGGPVQRLAQLESADPADRLPGSGHLPVQHGTLPAGDVAVRAPEHVRLSGRPEAAGPRVGHPTRARKSGRATSRSTAPAATTPGCA